MNAKKSDKGMRKVPIIKTIVYVVRNLYKSMRNYLKLNHEIVAFIGDDASCWNSMVDGIPIYDPERTSHLDYDVIMVGNARYEFVR